MPLLKRFQTIKSYTLIEIIVTVIILSVGFLGILSAFSFGSRNNLVSDNKLRAANKGRELLEDLRAKTDQRIWEGSWKLICNGSEQIWPGETFEGNSISYTCTEISGARKVTLTLTWTD